VNKPLLHVVIPAYGESPYLKETLASATRNLPLNVPITVLEDPSASTSVRETVANFLDRVEYKLNSERLGIGGNFNKAIDLSSGSFTWICGPDDLILNDPSQEIAIFLERENVAAIITKVNVIGADGDRYINTVDGLKKIIGFTFQKSVKFSKNGFLNRILIGYWLYFPAIIWNTNTLKKEKFSEKLDTALDLDLLLRLNRKSYDIHKLEKKTLAYRRHLDSQSSKLAVTSSRFVEEFKCHRDLLRGEENELTIFTRFLATLSISIRLHCIYYYLKTLVINKINRKDLLKLIFHRV
jgi:glycosyltransferase involved in cell wall biosynthesis